MLTKNAKAIIAAAAGGFIGIFMLQFGSAYFQHDALVRGEVMFVSSASINTIDLQTMQVSKLFDLSVSDVEVNFGDSVSLGFIPASSMIYFSGYRQLGNNRKSSSVVFLGDTQTGRIVDEFPGYYPRYVDSIGAFVFFYPLDGDVSKSGLYVRDARKNVMRIGEDVYDVSYGRQPVLAGEETLVIYDPSSKELNAINLETQIDEKINSKIDCLNMFWSDVSKLLYCKGGVTTGELYIFDLQSKRVSSLSVPQSFTPIAYLSSENLFIGTALKFSVFPFGEVTKLAVFDVNNGELRVSEKGFSSPVDGKVFLQFPKSFGSE